MFLKRSDKNIRFATYAFLALCLTAAAIFWSGIYSTTTSAQARSSVPTSNAAFATFPGSGFGDIPDGGAGCPQPGAPLTIAYEASGLSGVPTGISLSMTLGHPYMGDISATLYAPDGSSQILFERTGATAATAFGDNTNLGATYIFSDTAPAQPSGGWWQEAAARTTAEIMTAGTYRTTEPGSSTQTSPAPFTNLDAAFAGVADPNGTWSLIVTDGCAVDTGSVTASTLTISTGGPSQVQHVTDFNGDGKTDISVARNEGGTIVWYNYDGISNPPAGITYAFFGAAATDFIVPEDFDGDNKSDITVWRPGVAGSAGFYTLQSTNNTVRFEALGVENDDPAVVGDYDGDGKADPTVYSCPSVSGPDGQCYFHYRGSLNNPSGNVTSIPWGFGVDGDFFPLVGDFNGDGKNDFCIQRSNPSNLSQGQFILLLNSIGTVEYIDWGFSSDFLIPGDYDGDGKSDFCVRRTVGGFRNHYVLLRTGAGFFQQWGITGDVSVPGDYDGDGKTDIAVWRGSSTPGQTAFYILNSGNNSVRAFQWGQCPDASNCDYPPANWSVH
ncbi:MAG: VCBS repeat-containing protein [Chloracidobacterium sp.]|nr:VCBS repeat-containing protein [Chloracidobacterium sp.]